MALRVESVQFDELSADPTSPVDGQAWYNTTTDQLKARISGTTRKIAPPPELYDAIVAPSGGDYTSVYDVFNAGHTTVYVRSGTYIETNTIVVPDGGQLIGEDGAVINFNGGAFRVECDGSGGTQETTGTIAVTQDSAAVVGTGTTFTNLSVGDQIEIGPSYFEIATITDNTNLTITKPWRGPTTSGLAMFGQTMHRNVRLKNIRILNSAIQGLFVRATLGLKLDGVNVFNCTGNNIEMRNNYGANVEQCISKNSLANGFYLNGCHEAGFDGYCHGDNNDGKGIHIDGACDDVKISSSSFTSNGGDGVSVNGTSHNCSITACVASYNGGKGFDTTSGTSATSIASCVVEHNTGYGIDWDGAENSITSCTITDNGGGLQGGDGGTIIGNHIESNNGIGINLADGDDHNAVVGNDIRGNTGDGIRIDCDDCLFVGNIISTNGGDGVSILVGANDNRFSNNDTAGNTGTDFDDAGTGTLVLDGDLSTTKSAQISGVTEKTTPVSADLLLIEDSAASNAKKRVQVGNLPAAAPAAHATTHQSGGSDSIKLDDLAAADDNTDLNSSTSAHGLLPKLGGGSTNYLRADGTWAQPPGTGSTFGSEHYEAESTSESSTTSSTWQTKVSFTTSSLPSGKYRIGFSAEFSNSKDELTEVRVQVEGTTYATPTGYPYSTDEWMSAAGFFYIDPLSGGKTVTIQYRAVSQTAYIRNARIELWRIS